MIDFRVALFAASSALSLSASAREFAILYHESPSGLGHEQWAERADTRPEAGSSDSSISFTAFGRQFDLNIRSNSRLIKNLPIEQRRLVQDVDFYSGELRNMPGSWVRLTVVDGLATGAIWDGNEMYAVEPRADVAAYLATPEASPESEQVIYRLKDSIGSLSDAFIADNHAAQIIQSAHDGIASLVAVPAVFAPMQQLNIAVVGDSRLPEGQNSAAYLLGLMNTVDGVFLSQLGLYLNVAEILIYDAASDPFSTSTGSDLLGQMAQVKTATPALRDEGLAHLFTGRNLVSGTGDDTLVGIANLGAVCAETYGVAVTEVGPGVPSALVAAHEIGHNFGAPHDNEPGSVCESTPDGFLMNPQVSGDSFSDCSIEQMTPHLESAACLSDIAPGDLELRSVDTLTTVGRGDPFDITIAVDNLGAGGVVYPELTGEVTDLRLLDVRPVLSELDRPPWDCYADLASFVCRRNTQPAGESHEFVISLRALNNDGGTVTARVEAQNDPVDANNRLMRFIETAPDVDVLSGFRLVDRDNYLFRPNDVATIQVVTVNHGIDVAHDVATEFGLPAFLEVISVTPSAGSCGAVSGESIRRCSLGMLAHNEEATIDVHVRALQLAHQDVVWRSGTLTVSSTLSDVDDQPGNNSYVQEVFVSDRYVTLFAPFSLPVDIEAGTEAVFPVTISNRGDEEATGIRIQFTYSGYAISGAVSRDAAVNCVHEPALSRVICEVPVVSPNEDVSFVWSGVVGTASDAGGQLTLNVQLRPREYNFNGNDSSFDYVASVAAGSAPAPQPTPQPPPSPSPGSNGGSGGGGGAFNPGWLLLFAGWRIMRTRRGWRVPDGSRSVTRRHGRCR